MNQLTLRDADEIERFFVETTGMKPGYVQLERGLANLQLQVCELAGVTLIWCRASARARWRDEMTGDALHLGVAVEADGRITARGREIDTDAAQVWVPGQEMDLIMDGPNLTLDLSVAPALLDELGWRVGGDPLRRVPPRRLQRLVRTCQRATEAVGLLSSAHRGTPDTALLTLWRDQVLDQLEPLLRPWLDEQESKAAIEATRCYRLVRLADDFFDRVDSSAPFEIEGLADAIGVPRRTLFHAYRRVLGVGPRQYFELKRLHTLRSRLRRADAAETTVTRMATDLGFSDLGRLASRYRRQFGENPSDTLKSCE